MVLSAKRKLFRFVFADLEPVKKGVFIVKLNIAALLICAACGFCSVHLVRHPLANRDLGQGHKIVNAAHGMPACHRRSKINMERIQFTQTEISMIEAVVMHEVGHCSRESKIAVANVILNRLQDGRFGGSVYEVLHKNGQFEAIHNYYEGEIEPDMECKAAVLDALRGENNSQGALYYCNMDYIQDERTKGWFQSMDFLFELDGQRFYR